MSDNTEMIEAVKAALKQLQTQADPVVNRTVSQLPFIGSLVRLAGSRKAVAGLTYAIVAVVNKKLGFAIDPELMTNLLYVTVALMVGIAIEDAGKGKAVVEATKK